MSNDHLNLDFGDEELPPAPEDPQFDAWLSAAAPEVNAPSPTPAADMWSAIAPQVAAKPQTIVMDIRSPRPRQYFWPAAIAAALVAGVFLGRNSTRTNTAAVTAPAATIVAAKPATPAAPNTLYRMAAVQTLSQAEALLTAYRANNSLKSDPASTKQLGLWGRQVLSSTRLLLDSPAGDDPQLRALLDDLELVLVQVIGLSGTPLDASERTLIDRAIKDRDLLPRIRSTVPAGASSASAD